MYLVLDNEATGTTTERRFCNPLNPNHEVNLVGYKYQGKEFQYFLEKKLPDLTGVSVIVGQNLKFDLLWFWGDSKLQDWLKNGGKVWDTQTVQYLLDGQQKIPRSLDDLALKYGGSLKDSDMKNYYKSGGLTKDIPLEKLLDYNKGDVENTNIVLQGQIKLAMKKHMLPLIQAYMEHYIAIIEMEYNGLHVNERELNRVLSSLKTEEQQLRESIINFAEASKYENFNPLSLDDLSLFLFGGITKIKKKMPQFTEDGQPIIVKKTGLQKEKFEMVSITQGWRIRIIRGMTKNKKGYWFLKDDILQNIINSLEDKDSIEMQDFCKNILTYRKLTKKISTYYEGLLECRSPYTHCVHPEFKTAFTDTGRLSSINPNAQNLLPEILDFIDSRYGQDGQLIEIDFHQLEICLQAYITGCWEMAEDIKKGIDFHTLRLSYAEGLSYEETLKRVHSDHKWALKRKAAKTVSFQKAYGAAPAKIAQETGLSEDTIKKIFSEEDLRYPEIKAFYENIAQGCASNRWVTRDLQRIKDKTTGAEFTKPGEQQGYGYYKSITNKEYIFQEKAVLTKTGKIFRYFSMPKIQNSPVQGIAADFVSCQVGQFYRWLKKSGLRCWMVDEVHDSIILDCHRECLTEVTTYAKIILENTKKFESLTNRKFNVPMEVDIKINDTWGKIKQND